MSRPTLRVRPYVWKDRDGNYTEGIGLFAGQDIKGHYTPDEARTLADKLHDRADSLEAPEAAR